MASQAFSVSCELPASVAEAYQQLTDEAFICASYAGREGVAVAVCPTATGHDVSVSRPVGPQLAGPGLRLNLRQQWRERKSDGDDNDNGKVARVCYQLLGPGLSIRTPASLASPLRIDGEMRLVANGGAATLSAELSARISVPLSGSAAVNKLAAIARDKVAADVEYQREALASKHIAPN